MADKPWKAEERRVAAMFGTERALMKGTDEKSDIQSDLFTVDAKLRKKWSVQKWYRELRETAALHLVGTQATPKTALWVPRRIAGNGDK